jgi:hypothetical protein
VVRSRPSALASRPIWLMSALGHKQTFRAANGMSALPPKADIGRGEQHVR